MIVNEKMQGIIDELNVANLEIPFGNSEFQNLNFVLNAEITPERKYRHCLLRLNNRISALKECYYALQLEDIDIEEMEYKLKVETNDFEKRRIVIKIEQKRANRIGTEKMVHDCLEEISTLYNAFKILPKYTRAEFEAGERDHYELKLASDMMAALKFGQAQGIVQSLDSMGSSKWAFEVYQNPMVLQERLSTINRLELGGSNVDKI